MAPLFGSAEVKGVNSIPPFFLLDLTSQLLCCTEYFRLRSESTCVSVAVPMPRAAVLYCCVGLLY